MQSLEAVISELRFCLLPSIKELWEDHINSLDHYFLIPETGIIVLSSHNCCEQLRTQALETDNHV